MSLPSFLHRKAAPTPPARITIRRRLLGRGSRLRSAGVAAGLLGLGLASAQPARAATYSWNGVPGDWFSNPSNWTLNNLPASYPGAGDDAQNLTTAAMTLGQGTTVNHQLLSDGAFTLNGGQFSGNQANAASTLQINNIFTINGGQVNNFTLKAGVQQSGQPAPSVVVTGNTGNSINNSVVNANLDMTTNASAFLNFVNTNMVNGMINLATTSNGLQIQDGNASLTLGSTGGLTGFGSVFQAGGNARLTNNGLLNATGGTLTTALTYFTNTGTMEATNGGTLALANTLTTNTGALTASGAKSVVSITSNFASGAGSLITATNGGQVQVNGAALTGTLNTAAGTALIFNGSNNTLTNMTVNGNLDLATNTAAFADFAGVNTVNGKISLGTTTGRLDVQDGNASLTLSGGSSLTGFGLVNQDGGNAQLINAGLINATGGTLTSALTYFTNNGTMEATGGGTLALANTLTTNTGALTASGAKSVVSITSNFASGAGSLITATNGGQVQVNGAALTGTLNTDAGTALIFSNSTANTLTNMTVNGNLNLANTTDAFADFAGVNTVNGAITLGTTTGRLDVQDGNANLILGTTGSAASLTGFGLVNQDGGNAQLTNSGTGTINANASGKTLTTALTYFNNNGLAEATNGGTLALNNTFTTNNSTLAATGGGLLMVAGTLTSAATSTLNGVGGTIDINGAHLLGTLNGVGATTLVFNGDTSGNNLFNTTVNANLDLATNTNAFIDFQGVNTVTKAITLGTTTGRLDVQDGNAALTLSSAASLTGFGLVNQDGGNAQLINNGLLNTNANGKTLTTALTYFTNNGTAQATNGGTLALNNTFTANTGAVKATGAGSVVAIAGTFTGTGAASAGNLITATGGGQVQVNNASLRGTLNTAAGTALIFNNSTSNNLFNTTVNGNLNLANTTDAFADFAGVNTVNGAITLGTTTGRLDVQDGNANLILGTTGSAASLTGFGLVNQDGGNAQLTNSGTGTINANASGKTLTTALTYFNNNGLAEATNGGTLALNNTFTANNGALTASGAGSVVAISGNLASGANSLITATNGGQVQVNGAALTGTVNTAATTALVFNGSTANNLLNTTVNGNLDLATNTAAFADFAGTNTVKGAITLGTTTGRLDVQDGNANLILGTTGSLVGFGTVNQDGGNATLTNNGLVNATGGTLNVATTYFNNTGMAQATNGATLNVTSGNVTNSGTVAVQVGGTVNFTQGLTQTAGLTQVFGVLNASETLNGGVLGGSKTINGNIINNGGIVQPVVGGPGFASLNINGNFSQGSGGELDAFFGNNFHNLLNVSGQTTTGGTLGVFDLDQTQFTGTGSTGTQFAFLDYSGTLTPDGSTVNGFTQYFTNEMPDSNISGTIKGQNGFVFELTNIANPNGGGMLDLTVTKVGAPVPEASTTVSLGLLLALGLGGMVVAAKRKKKA